MNTKLKSNLFKTFVQNDDKVITCLGDKTVLQAISESGLLVEANCGGRGVGIKLTGRRGGKCGRLF
ncbi:MAG: hypothetical protein H6Q73_414 [Firmicutes bacterium]|nr:hypothetical protein [Bacillota bacterium]